MNLEKAKLKIKYELEEEKKRLINSTNEIASFSKGFIEGLQASLFYLNRIDNLNKNNKKRLTLHRADFKTENILDLYLEKFDIYDNSILEIDIYIDPKTIEKESNLVDFITINK